MPKIPKGRVYLSLLSLSRDPEIHTQRHSSTLFPQKCGSRTLPKNHQKSVPQKSSFFFAKLAPK